MCNWVKLRKCLGIAGFFTVVVVSNCFAGVFSTPHAVQVGRYSLGLEPQVIFGSPKDAGTGAGLNFRYTHGVSEMNNIIGIIGTGDGPQQFRIGGGITYDFFPDNESQPGLGLMIHGLFVRLPSAGSVEVVATPYIHKTFRTERVLLEPFLAVPVGLSLSSGKYDMISTLSLGSFFHHTEHLSTIVELGLSISDTISYISGGLVYYH